MPSPISIFFSTIKLSFQSQWDDVAKENIAVIIHSRIFSILSTLFASSLILQIVTGIILSIHFSPSSAPLVNNQGKLLTAERSASLRLDPEGDTLALPGDLIFLSANPQDIIPTQSYFSIAQISQITPLNNIRAIHTFNTHVLIASIITIILFFGIHVRQALVFKGIWIVLMSIGLLIASIAWLGYILPWDQFASTSFLIVQGLIEQGIGLHLGEPHDIIARYFSLHSILFPLIMLLMLWLMMKMFRMSFRTFNQMNLFAFMILLMFVGIFAESYVTLLPPADAFLPSSSNHIPAWFFRPIHGIVSTMPADLAILLISISIFSLYALPFFQSHKLRISVLVFILISSIFFALIY